MNPSRISSDEKEMLSTYIGVGILILLALVAAYYVFVLAKKEVAQVRGFDPNRPVPTDTVLRKRLSAEAWGIVREHRMETPFQNKFWNDTNPGIYVDVITGEPLFSSADKFDAGVGLPTFSKPISNDLVVESLDTRFHMQRIEVLAKRSNGFLGHRFPEPKSPTGQRYTVNSAAFRFIPLERMKEEGYEAYLPLLEKK